MKESTNKESSSINDQHLRILEKENIECGDISEILGDYYEGDLTASLKNRVDEHFNQCSYCREFNSSYNAVITLAKELKNKPINRKIEDGVQKRLRMALNQKLGLNLPI